MVLEELPDNLMPRGSDMSPRDACDLAATNVGLMSERDVSDEIDRLDVQIYGARVDALLMVDGRLSARIPDDDAELPTFLALSSRRMLLRARQLALRHDPEHSDEHVRYAARQWAEVLAESARHVHDGGEQ